MLIISHSEPDLNMTYVCECTICGQRFDVEQGCHHFEWWNWVAVEPDAQDD